MNKFIGTKEVKARPLNLGAYNALRGWETPANENPDTEGYLVEYLDSPNKNHPDYDNYISWSPKDVFERSYRRNETLTFGQAIEAVKQGKRIARHGWNGKSMFLFLLPAGTVPTKAIHDPALREVIETEIGGETFEALGSIRMFTADKKILTGWLASQTDILAEDWVILP
jgi:hypothetical protein